MGWLGLSPPTDMWGGCPDAQPGPGCPYLAPSLGQAISLSCLGEIRLSGCSHAEQGSGVGLLPTPGGEERDEEGEPWNSRSSPTPGLSFPIFKKGVMGSQQALPEDWVP